jgi:hypothetical protein
MIVMTEVSLSYPTIASTIHHRRFLAWLMLDKTIKRSKKEAKRSKKKQKCKNAKQMFC